MFRLSLNDFVLASVAIMAIITFSCSSLKEEYKYPTIISGEVTDTYHGITITDSYRNIENTKDSVVMNWMKNQSIYADQILNKLDGRDLLIEKQKSFDQKSLFRIYGTKKINDSKYY